MWPCARFAIGSSGPPLPRLDRFHRIILLEQIEENAERFAARRFEVGVAGEDKFGVVAGGFDKIAVDSKVGEAEARQARLALTQKFAGATQAQIFLRDHEAIVGVAQAIEPGAGGFAQR